MAAATYYARKHRHGKAEISGDEAIFIYRNGVMVEANAAGLRLLAGQGKSENSWRALRRLLAERFPDFPANQGTVQDQETTVLAPLNAQDTSVITIDQWQDVARVSILSQKISDIDGPPIETEISLRAPYPIWICDNTGAITWCNFAYHNFALSLGHVRAQKPPHLFDIPAQKPGPLPWRVGIDQQSEALTYWFDVTAVSLKHGTVFFAVDANTIVSAEMTQRSIVQTLSQTFAQLPTGLAIFDRNRRLVLFNPSLTALTDLPASVLSDHPTITAFFDALRESRIAPEPQSSKPWQEHVADIIRSAEQGGYCETWELPSGKTYRVTGRPQPDGAIAILFDDISAEMSLTRRFRSDIDIAHAALDALDDPVALFSQSGEHLLCNHAYRSFWKADPDTSFAPYTIHDATTLWASEVCDTPAWQDFRSAVLSKGTRQIWTGTLALRTFGLVDVALTPIAGGATLVRFRRSATRDVTQPA
ncbi:PAS-domain containing protein [Shimia sp. SK013]|uniref:PAS-domain containing protein n=1 Tax=Shimia sp. SK013 TaxID=1389006 RepID=UPI00128EA09B|nr:PAS-domain containing protein [Shimia sp. SK013]